MQDVLNVLGPAAQRSRTWRTLWIAWRLAYAITNHRTNYPCGRLNGRIHLLARFNLEGLDNGSGPVVSLDQHAEGNTYGPATKWLEAAQSPYSTGLVLVTMLKVIL